MNGDRVTIDQIQHDIDQIINNLLENQKNMVKIIETNTKDFQSVVQSW